LGQKRESERLWLSYGRAMRNGGGKRCWEVVGAIEWRRDGGGAARSQTRGQGVGCGPKIRNRALAARLRACRAKWRWAVVLGGGECGRMAQRRRGGWAFANARLGGGVWAKNPNRALATRLPVCRAKWRCAVVLGGGGCNRMAQRRRGGCAFTNVRSGGVVWAKNPKPSTWRSISGMPCNMAVWGIEGWWW